jgi:carbon-monoxide dehydrogenase medium subunit
VKPPPLDYEAPTQLGEAVALLRDPGRDVIVLAGGQSLMPMLNLRLARPDLLVDLRRVEGLQGIELDGDHLVIGAMTTKRAAEESALVRRHHPLLHAATCLVGHPQIRNRGTVGGSMAHADPAAEYPAVAVACDAEMVVVGAEGERRVGAEDFFVGYLTTAMEPGELLAAVRIPVMAEGTGWSFQELSRRHGDFAMVGAAVTLSLDGGRCTAPRIVVFAVGPTPLRARHAEAVVEGESPSPGVFARAAEAVRDAIEEPLTDVHASAEYRRHLAGVMVERALQEAAARAAGGS